MTKYIASIHFEERRALRPSYGGSFYTPAVVKGAPPFILAVHDHIQPEKQPHLVGGHIIKRPITGEEIAIDLIHHWTSGVLGMKGDVRPGLWVVRDMLPLVDETGTPVRDVYGAVQTRPATEEEKAAMWAEDLAENTACQARWGEFCIQQGEVLANDENSKMRLLIGPTLKAAAKYYGREVEWTGELAHDDRKLCGFCYKSIDKRVAKCPSCGEIVDRAAYARLTGGQPNQNKEKQPVSA